MNALKYLNKYFYKYRTKLFLGFLITIIARIFSLFAPRLIGNSLTAVEKYLQSENNDFEKIQHILMVNILIIIGGFINNSFGNLLTRASAFTIVIIMINALAIAHRDWFINTKLFTSEQIFLLLIGLFFLIKGNK